MYYIKSNHKINLFIKIIVTTIPVHLKPRKKLKPVETFRGSNGNQTIGIGKFWEDTNFARILEPESCIKPLSPSLF